MNTSFEDFPRMCRLCLITSDQLHVFNENVLKIMNHLANIQVTDNDKLPKSICNDCFQKIESIFSFIEKWKRNHQTLLIISQNKDKNPEADSNQNNYNSCSDDYKAVTKHLDEKLGNNDNFKGWQKTHKPVLIKTEKASVLCENCKSSFKSKVSLGTHYKKNKECRPPNFKIYKCDVCLKEFRTRQQKKEHLNVHTGATPYICSYCGKGFKFHSKHYVHIYRHKLELGLVEKRAAYTEKRVRLKLKCERCEKVFASRWGFERHKMRHEGKVIPRKYAPVKIDKDNRPYLCNFCAKSFYVKANLDTHLRVHTGEKPFECDHCGKKFKQKSALGRHALNHLDDRPKPFVCDICEKSFTTKAHMEVHKRLHTGEKPYECNFCGKCFNYRSHWKIHLRMHTGESPFMCYVCNNRYHDKGSLKRHQKKKEHHIKDSYENISEGRCLELKE